MQTSSTATTDSARHRVLRAEQRLRAALEAVTAAQHSQSNVAESHPKPTAAASAPPLVPGPRVMHLEWPLAPLVQRAKIKTARDAARQRRRAARQAAAAAAAASPVMSAAEVMRSTLSQPLGAMAARLLSAAPSLFADTTPAVQGESALKAKSSPPPTQAALTGVVVAATKPLDLSAPSPPAAAPLGSPPQRTGPRSPSPQSYSHQGHAHPRHQGSGHHRHARVASTSLLGLSTTSLSLRQAKGTPDAEVASSSTIPARLDVHQRRDRRHKHHRRGCSRASMAIPISASAAENAASGSFAPAAWRARETPTSALPPSRDFFSNSPLSLFTRTFGAGSPTPDAARHTAKHGASGSSAAAAATPQDSAASPTALHHRAARPLGALDAASTCSCSTCSCSSCTNSSDSDCWPAASQRDASLSAVPDTRGQPMLLPSLMLPRPGELHYDPRAPLPLLLRCYGDAATQALFHDASTSTATPTESRSSTPFSSEWSANSSTTTPSAAALARSTSTAEAATRGAPHTSEEGSRRRRPRPHRDPVLSPLGPATQLSFAAEMDAIEKGQVAPYVSYLFAPEARVVDLAQAEGQLQLPRRRRDPSLAAVSATCVAFCPASDAYLVGTSSGVLWRVPVGGSTEAVRATPLGSLWPPHAPGGSEAANGVGVPSLSATASPITAVPSSSTGAAAALDGASSAAATAGSPSSFSQLQQQQQPIPLSGHTAAILSLAFNDDGTLFATTGLDGSIIVWKASTSAKLRRISAVWATAASSASRAPHLVRFMPQNNNYLLVSYVGSGELHLYNSSTGLPVTNVAGTGLTRMTVSSSSGGGGGSSHRSLHRAGDGPHHSGGGRGGRDGQTGGGAITALAVDLVASPFFFSGDADGNVVLWTYRAGELVTWPTLGALKSTFPSSSSSGSGTGVGGGGGKHARTRSYSVDPLGLGVTGRSSGGSPRTISGSGRAAGDAVFSTPLHQLPELRRVAACALPTAAGGVAAISVSTLHAPQLHSLFRPCGPSTTFDPAENRLPSQAATATATGGASSSAGAVGGAGRPAQPRHPLEATAQLFHSTAALNRACRVELEAQQKAAESAAAAAGSARGRRDGATDVSSAAKGNSSSGGSSGFPQVLSGLPSRLSDTFSSLWGGGTSGSGSGHPSKSPAAGARRGDPQSPAPQRTEREMLRDLRSDALDVVCPLLLLVSAPCDTVYSLGLLLQLQHGSGAHSAGGGGHAAGSSAAGSGRTTVSYRLYPLLKTVGPSRLRHLGVGAVPAPDNTRLVVMAAPCEEGFVRVLPLLRVDSTAAAITGTSATAATGAVPTAARVNKKHVLATLPMPYGGRCTAVAWSPNGRFLVAVTAEGVVYQWSRVYLLNSAASHKATGTTTAAAAAAAAAVVAVDREQQAERPPLRTSTGHSLRKPSAEALAAATAAVRRRGCDTEFSDAVHHHPPATLNFSSLLVTPAMSGPAVSPTASRGAVAESEAARAAFSEEDAWRESLQRELERQRREQAVLKLVSQPPDADGDEVSSSGYWLDEAAVSDISPDTFGGGEETTLDGQGSSSA